MSTIRGTLWFKWNFCDATSQNCNTFHTFPPSSANFLPSTDGFARCLSVRGKMRRTCDGNRVSEQSRGYVNCSKDLEGWLENNGWAKRVSSVSAKNVGRNYIGYCRKRIPSFGMSAERVSFCRKRVFRPKWSCFCRNFIPNSPCFYFPPKPAAFSRTPCCIFPTRPHSIIRRRLCTRAQQPFDWVGGGENECRSINCEADRPSSLSLYWLGRKMPGRLGAGGSKSASKQSTFWKIPSLVKFHTHSSLNLPTLDLGNKVTILLPPLALSTLHDWPYFTPIIPREPLWRSREWMAMHRIYFGAPLLLGTDENIGLKCNINI